MKSLILFVGFFAISNITFAQVSESGFRNAKWGMTIDQVRSTEPDAEWQTDDTEIGPILFFETTIAGLKALAVYYFLNEKLEKCVYMNSEEQSRRTEFINNYGDLMDILANKHGKPSSEIDYWQNDIHKLDPLVFGTAIVDLKYFAAWESEESTKGIIRLTVTEDNFRIYLSISYVSPGFSKALHEVNKKIDANKI